MRKETSHTSLGCSLETWKVANYNGIKKIATLL